MEKNSRTDIFFNELIEEVRRNRPAIEDHYDDLINRFCGDHSSLNDEELKELHVICDERSHLPRLDGRSYGFLYFLTKNELKKRRISQSALAGG